MNNLAGLQCVTEDNVGQAFNLNHRIAFLVFYSLGGQIAALQVIGGKEVRIHLEGRIHVLHQMGTGNRITVSIRQLVNTAQATSLQICIHSLIVRQEACISSVSGQQIHQLGSLNDGLKLAVVLTIADIIAQHLTREGVEIFAVRLIGATRQRSCGQAGRQCHQSYFNIILDIHILFV